MTGITKNILKLTPNIPIVSEETVNIKIKNKAKIFWLIDPIDGTKEYIAGKEEYTLNAALVIDQVPIIGLVGVPKKNRHGQENPWTFGKVHRSRGWQKPDTARNNLGFF